MSLASRKFNKVEIALIAVLLTTTEQSGLTIKQIRQEMRKRPDVANQPFVDELGTLKSDDIVGEVYEEPDPENDELKPTQYCLTDDTGRKAVELLGVRGDLVVPKDQRKAHKCDQDDQEHEDSPKLPASRPASKPAARPAVRNKPAAAKKSAFKGVIPAGRG
jgi:hypothetical protein